MMTTRSFSLYLLASALLVPAFANGQGVVAAARIVNRIDETQLHTLKGNIHPFATAKNDRGQVAADLPMTDLILVLSRTPQQQAAFDAYVASEYDQNSPNYHLWLTPDQVGEEFGPSQTDILTITNWLTYHGLSVSNVARDHMSIRFSGTAAQVEGAFHTEIHNLQVNGKMHIGNMSDPQIPAALGPVVVGIKSLHNFFPHPLHRMGQVVQRDASTGMWARPSLNGAATSAVASTGSQPNSTAQLSKAFPQFGINGSVSGSSYLVEDVGPWDFATIYNVAPLWNNGIDGTGQTIAIAGTSAINLGESTTGPSGALNANGLDDVATFRTFFDLPTGNSWNHPIQISGNSQPLTVCLDTSTYCSLSDLIENSLDVEWSGAVAKNAQIVLVASYPNGPSDDALYDSESYIVDNVGNPNSPVYGVHVMNVSYGNCELAMGTAGNVQYYDLWQTAAAEGIAVFVASGDSGSASCDQGGDGGGANLPYAAQYGTTVSGLASTPYDTAVGGTDFNWCPLYTDITSECSAPPHWSSTNQTPPGAANGSSASYSALGYVPEVPWNDTCTSSAALSGLEWIWNTDSNFDQYFVTPYKASNGQSYSVTDAETACNDFVYNSFGLNNKGVGGLLYLVDTVGGSGGASNCVVNSTNPGINSTTVGSCTADATSTGSTNNPATNAPQGSLTVVNDGWPKPSWQTGVTGIPSDGVRDIPDVSFFASAGFLSSSAYLVCVSAANGTGFNGYGGAQPCSYSSSNEPFAQEVGGTSVATPAMAGIMALINQKAGAAQGNPNSELYALAAKQTYASCSAESVTANSNCYFNDIDQGTIAMPCVANSATYSGVTGLVLSASPNCNVLHAGDYAGVLDGYSAGTGYDETTGLGSLNVANVVNGWTAVTPGSATPTVTVTPQPASIDPGDVLQVAVTVAGAAGAPQDPNGHTIPPTGTVTMTTAGTTYAPSATLSSGGTTTFMIPALILPGGQTDTLHVSYAGDVNYAAANGTGNVIVSSSTPASPTMTLTPVLNGSTFTVTVTVSGSAGTATGFITLSASSASYTPGYPSTTETIGTAPCTSASNCAFTVPTSSLGAGPVSLTAIYGGEPGVYGSASITVPVTFTAPTFRLTTGTVAPSSVTPGGSATVTITAAAVGGYSGTVTLSCGQSSGPTTGDGAPCSSTTSSQINLATCGASCSVTFTVGTTAPVAALARPELPGGKKGLGGEWLGAGSGAVLALVFFLGIPARRRSWRNMLVALFAFAAIGVMASCGGGSKTVSTGGNSDPGTTAGTYTYTVTATASPSVTPTVSTTFTVIVN